MFKKSSLIFQLLSVGIVLLAACTAEPVPSNQTAVSTEISVGETAVPPTPLPLPTPTATATAKPRPVITLPISVYIVDDEAGQATSNRDAAEITAIYEKVNDIWAQAGIVIEVQTVQRLTLPDAIVGSVAQGDFRPFFAGIEYEFAIPEPALLNGFYARDIGGPNGIVPFGADLFFVADEPSVHDERVTSHEIGHILGLHHTLFDSDRLLFSGTNGTALTEEEISVARYVAQGLLDRVR